MYFYFSSDYPAAVKFNGIYFGQIQSSVKACNFEGDKIPLVEIASLNGTELPRAFLPDENFLSNPPENVIVTDLKGGYLIKFLKSNTPREFSVLTQEKYNDLIVTVFNENGFKLSLETPADFYAETVDFAVCSAKAERFYLDGTELIAVCFYSETPVLNVYSFSGKIEKLFSRAVNSFTLENGLVTTENFLDMAKHEVSITWEYASGKILEQSRAVKKSDSFNMDNLPCALIPFAFAEEFLVKGDYVQYLTGNVKDNKEKIAGYLGNFIGVMPPPLFRNKNEVGLIYNQGKNKFVTDYFIFEVDENKKIFNIKKTT